MLADQLRDLGYRVLKADTAAGALRVLITGVRSTCWSPTSAYAAVRMAGGWRKPRVGKPRTRR
jgi:hypothetical protein